MSSGCWATCARKSTMHVTTEIDPKSGAIYARNPYNGEFAEWIGFFDVDDPTRTVTGDRTEFIGRNRQLAQSGGAATHAPVGPSRRRTGSMRRHAGDGRPRAGAGARDRVSPRRCATTSRQPTHWCSVSAALPPRMTRSKAVSQHWQQDAGRGPGRNARRGAQLPDQRLARLSNDGLPPVGPQRLLPVGRRFRLSRPAAGCDGAGACRAALRCVRRLCCVRAVNSSKVTCSTGGIRHRAAACGRIAPTTICGCHWRPAATCSLPAIPAILDENVALPRGPAGQRRGRFVLRPAGASDDSADVYEHCVRAILHGLKFGEHGLPLIGLRRLERRHEPRRHAGKGESVWLAFFLCSCAQQFAPLARMRGDTSFAARCEHEAGSCRYDIEEHAWDGDWYRRAYFDDGTPLGSKSNTECQIDSISQSWSVLSGAGDAERAHARRWTRSMRAWCAASTG